jgi:hypothetical protein
MEKQDLPAPPRQSAGPAPLRIPGSVRRTSTIDIAWPDGQAGNMRVNGRARDIFTPPAGGGPVVLAEDAFEAVIRKDRTIVAIASDPARPALARLVGERGGGGLRQVIADAVPDELQHATPLYLILDDISGTSLISTWAWSQWNPDWLEAARAAMGEADLAQAMANRVGVCTGFAPGSSALDPDVKRSGGARAPDLRNPEDPEGWHAFTVQVGVGLRRARRIDVTEADVIAIDTAFQDTATTPDGGRAVVHEYSMRVTADPISLCVLSIDARPRVLPFPECPVAANNLTRLLGTPMAALREKVFAELKGTAGCTHLNDAARALADVPALVKRLRPRSASGTRDGQSA